MIKRHNRCGARVGGKRRARVLRKELWRVEGVSFQQYQISAMDSGSLLSTGDSSKTPCHFLQVAQFEIPQISLKNDIVFAYNPDSDGKPLAGAGCTVCYHGKLQNCAITDIAYPPVDFESSLDYLYCLMQYNAMPVDVLLYYLGKMTRK